MILLYVRCIDSNTIVGRIIIFLSKLINYLIASKEFFIFEIDCFRHPACNEKNLLTVIQRLILRLNHFTNNPYAYLDKIVYMRTQLNSLLSYNTLMVP